jgi:hypothetical protein
MSSYIQPKIKAYNAEIALPKFTFVKFGTAQDGVLLSGAAERSFGVNMTNDVEINCVAEVALIGGGALVKLAGTVAKGDSITSDASGLGIVATSGDFCPAIAMDSGVTGDVISVILDVHAAI